MAYKKVTPERYQSYKLFFERLLRFKNPFSYDEDISLAAFGAAVDNVKTTGDTLNTKIDEAEAAGDDHVAACAEAERLLKALRTCIGGVKGKNSDEYVTAGGKRLSDTLALQDQSREEKKKVTDEAAKKAADEAIRKAAEDAVRKEAEEAAKKNDKTS